ncbi:DUF1819 family protein [Lactobacillus sp. LC28-10]|uniref:DUF1819 family protein n=1 Tax=Secundilactobacillus angelensis TaxID=2722706 RepID=A0ABX1KUX4_9LACO|nr:DUF1819 family protein [Secundilactobacillus angelensis]MCH5461946.1 DUF1819 family protein [Secundilactobacillus angelensis]NLR17434.1 DUF1819 family protein [Secundilactobacillus angelensis]
MDEYSAGAVKYGFWFNEFDQLIRWVLDGTSDQSIKDQLQDGVFLKQKSRQRSLNVTSRLLTRIHSLTTELQKLYPDLDRDNQRLLVLISIMNTDRLIHDFMITCFKDAVVLGDERLQDYELDAFFTRMQATHESIAKWQDQTITRLKGTIRNYLRESGIVRSEGDDLVLRRPLLDPRLIDALVNASLQEYLVTFTGRTYE